MPLPFAPVSGRVFNVVVLSPYRLVPLALAAAGRSEGTFEVTGAADGPEEALELIRRGPRTDVFVFDPTALSLGRSSRLLIEVAAHLLHPKSIALLLEPAQAATGIAARFAWEAGVRCAMSSQDSPECWPIAIAAASRGATYVSPAAEELLEIRHTSNFDMNPVFSLEVPRRSLASRHQVLGAI